MKFPKNNLNILLIIIVLLGAIIRLYKLGSFPVSLNVDEVSIAYDAFSILKTGKDHYGKSFPLVFESIGDFKNGAYIYLTAATQFFLGVNEFSVRFPSAIFGILFIPLCFKFAQILFKDKKIPYLLALLITFSPWHIRFSRGAYEANVALTILFLGLYFLLKRINQKASLFLPIILMIFSAYIYHSEKILVPLLFISTFLIFRKNFIQFGKRFPLKILLLFILTIPLLITQFGNSQGRSSTVMANLDPEIVLISNESSDFSKFSNKYLIIYSSFRRYFQYLDPSFLFINGMQLTQHINLNQGLLYLIEFPFFIAGIYLFFKNKSKLFNKKEYFYIFIIILLISPFPAAITLNDYHLIRPYTLIIPYLCFVVFGIRHLIKKPAVIMLLIAAYFVSFLMFTDYYFVHFSKEREEWIFYPSKNVALSVLDNLPKYQNIIVDPYFGKLGPYTRGVPDIYVLFYGKIHPKYLWQKGTSDLDKIIYRHIEWNLDKELKNTLLIGSPWSLPIKDIKSESLKEIILYNDGNPAYLVVETEK